jgi:nuclease HARBI1
MDDFVLLAAIAARVIYMRQDQRRVRTKLYKTVVLSFQFDFFNEEACLHLFRFVHEQLLSIVCTLFPSPFIAISKQSKVSRIEAFCILLNRLSYPSRLKVMEATFGKQFSVLSRVINSSIDLTLESFGHPFSLSSPCVTNAERATWMNAIHAKGAPLERCFGCVDGTVRQICRPSRHQKRAYNGHKRVHALKFQSVSAPNGLIVDLAGPWEGRRHDCGMLRESGLLARLEIVRLSLNPAYIYGYPAYPVIPVLQAPFKGSHLSDIQKEWNMRMSRVLVSVDWCFGKVLMLFPFADVKKNLKVYLQPVGKIYQIAVLFASVHTCVYGSLTTELFVMDALELEDYLRPLVHE